MVDLSDRHQLEAIGRACLQCGKGFQPRSKTQKYCGRACRIDARRRPHETRPCIHCGTPLLQDHRRLKFCDINCVRAHQNKSQTTSVCLECGVQFQHLVKRPQMYCSRDCLTTARRKRPGAYPRTIPCAHCGKMFVAPKSRQRYCSRTCGNLASRGGLLPDEEDTLVRMVCEHPLSEIAAAIERLHGRRFTPTSLRVRAVSMGLHTRVEPLRYFTVPQLAQALEMSFHTVCHWPERYDLPVRKYEGEAIYRISIADLKRWARSDQGKTALSRAAGPIEALEQLLGTNLAQEIAQMKAPRLLTTIYASDGRSWNSATEAAHDLDVQPSRVRTALREGQPILRARVRLSRQPFEKPVIVVDPRSRPVYSSDGRSWPSVEHAARELWLTKSAVCRAALRSGPTRAGVTLSYSPNPVHAPSSGKSKVVYSDDGRSWPSTVVAARELGASTSAVRAAAQNNRAIRHGPVLSYAPEPDGKRATKRIYADDGRSWDSATMAAKELEMNPYSVRAAARSNSTTRAGITLSHHPDPKPKPDCRIRPIYASDGRHWPRATDAAQDLGISTSAVWRSAAQERPLKSGITLSYRPHAA